MRKHTTSWIESAPSLPDFHSLTEDIIVDVAIIGGGITGITLAYLLSKSGKSVALLQKDSFSDSTTAYTTAFLTYEIDTDLTELIDTRGKHEAKLVWDSHKEAIDVIEKIVSKEKIDCEFIRTDEFIIATDEKEMKALEEEHVAAKEIGYALSLDKEPLFTFPSVGSLKFPDQAKFHPLKYSFALLKLAGKNGVKVYEKSEVIKFHKGRPNHLETKSGGVKAQHVVIATYDPLNHPVELFAKKGMYTSYVYEAALEKESIPEGLYMDQANPYHYIRVDKGEKKDRMIIGGEDHRHEIPIDPKKNFKALQEYLESIIPHNAYTITRQWSGPILEPSDGLAYIGSLYPHEQVYVATGFSGNGMTYGTIAGMLISDLIEKKKNPYIKLYDPLRLPSFTELLQKGKDYTEELFGGAVKNALKR